MLKRETGRERKGDKVSKDHPLIEALGTLDETSSFLGLTASFVKKRKIRQEIINLQGKLFLIGQDLALRKSSLSKKEVAILNKKITDYQKGQTQTKFVLPGGNLSSAWLHVCRSLVRRLERAVVSLNRKEKVNPQILTFLNRLSLLLFWMAVSENKTKK